MDFPAGVHDISQELGSRSMGAGRALQRPVAQRDTEESTRSNLAVETRFRALEAEIAQCHARMEERRTKIDEQTAQIEKAMKELADHKAQRTIADSHLEIQKSRNGELQSMIAHLQRALRERDNEGMLGVKSENHTADLASHTDENAEHARRLAAQLHDCESELQKAHVEIRDLKHHNEQISAQHTYAQQQVASLRIALADVEKAQATTSESHTSEPSSHLYTQRFVTLQIENERLSQNVQKSEQRALLFEKEVHRLEQVGEEFEIAKEKHLSEVSEMQSIIEDLGQRQSEAAKQVYRLMKDFRDANGETMDVMRWRDEERQEYDELKAEYEKVHKESIEEIAAIQSELQQSQLMNQKSTEHAEECMKQVATMENTLSLKADEILKQQLELSTCREELYHERNAHNILSERQIDTETELAEVRRFLSLTKDDMKSLETKNRTLRERLSKLGTEYAEHKVLEDQLQKALTATRGELDTVTEELRVLLREHEALRTKYHSSKDTEKKIRADLEKHEEAARELHAEKKALGAQKDECERVVHSLQNTQRDDRKEIHKHSEAIKALRNELHTRREMVEKLTEEIEKGTAAASNDLRKAQQERDTFIKKYHAACGRMTEIERDCHTAQQNYLREYASFEQLKLNQENALSTLKERVLSREEKFYAAIEREKQRASIAEEKLRKLSR